MNAYFKEEIKEEETRHDKFLEESKSHSEGKFMNSFEMKRYCSVRKGFGMTCWSKAILPFPRVYSIFFNDIVDLK